MALPAFLARRRRQRGGDFLDRNPKKIFTTHDCPAIVGFLFHRTTPEVVIPGSRKLRKTNMKTTRRELTAAFGPETRFDLTPVPPAPFRGVRETELERLKDRLLRELLERTEDGSFYAGYRRAANEAAALAWTTPFPLLFFPALFEEKARGEARYVARQESINRRGRRLNAVAA